MKKIISEINAWLKVFAHKGKIQNVIVNTMTSDLFWVLIACAAIRLVYYSCLLNTYNFVDTPSYLNYGANIFKGNIEPHRTPVYPYFIKLIRLFGPENLIPNIVYVQSLISFISIIFFYKTVNNVFKNRMIVVVSTFIFGIFPSIINWDKCILPESLTVSSFVLFIYLISSYINKPTVTKAIVSTFYIFILIMLRPAFLYVLPLIILFWVLRIVIDKKDIKMSIYGLISSFICVILLVGYSNLNFKRNGCNTISIVSSINVMYEIINFDMYENKDDEQLTQTIRKNMGGIDREVAIAMGTYSGPRKTQITEEVRMRIRDEKIWSSTSLVISKYSYPRITNYISGCLKQGYKIFTKEKIKEFIVNSQNTATIYLSGTKGGLMSSFLMLTKLFDISFIFIYLLLLFDGMFIFKQFYQTKQIPWFKVVIWTLIFTQLVTIIVGAPNNFERLILSALPCVLIVIFSYIDLIYSLIYKEKYKFKD